MHITSNHMGHLHMIQSHTFLKVIGGTFILLTCHMSLNMWKFMICYHSIFILTNAEGSQMYKSQVTFKSDLLSDLSPDIIGTLKMTEVKKGCRSDVLT